MRQLVYTQALDYTLWYSLCFAVFHILYLFFCVCMIFGDFFSDVWHVTPKWWEGREWDSNYWIMSQYLVGLR